MARRKRPLPEEWTLPTGEWGLRIWEAMERKGAAEQRKVTQREVVAISGVQEAAISKWLKAPGQRSAHVMALARVSRYLGVRMEWIALGDGPVSDYPDEQWPARKIALDFAAYDGTRTRVLDLVREMTETEHPNAAKYRPSDWMAVIKSTELKIH